MKIFELQFSILFVTWRHQTDRLQLACFISVLGDVFSTLTAVFVPFIALVKPDIFLVEEQRLLFWPIVISIVYHVVFHQGKCT